MRDWFDSIWDARCDAEDRATEWIENNVICDECGESFDEGFKYDDYLICGACRAKHEVIEPCEVCGESEYGTSKFPKIQITVCEYCMKRVSADNLYEEAS